MTPWFRRCSSLLLLWSLTACGSVWEERAARSGTVHGRVVSTTGNPIASQSVLYEPVEVPGVTHFEDKGIMTGPEGEYGMVLPAGIYDIRVRAPDGWQTQRVTVVPGQVTHADFTIERSMHVPHLGKVRYCTEEVPVSTRALGTSLGTISLGMSAEEIRTILGDPERVIDMSGTRPIQWIFPDVTKITLTSLNKSTVTTRISTRSSTLGRTAEGLALGDPIDTFGQIYQDFGLCAHATGFVVIGNNHRWLGVSFDEHDHVEALSITSEDPHAPQNQAIPDNILRR